MNSVVCIKQVPDTETRIKIGPDGRSIDPSEVEWVVNPYDEYAVEEALKLKEKDGQGEVIIVSLGGEKAATAIRSCLAMGADRGVLIKSEGLFGDAYATASALAAVIKEMGADLILLGKQAVDDDHAQVGQMLAVMLDLPCVTMVTKLEVTGRTARAHREVDGGSEIFETPLPAVITAEKDLNQPRYASLKGIMMAKKKTIEERNAPAMETRVEVVEMLKPAPRPAGRIIGEGKGAVPDLVHLLRSEAKVL
jgi:electron transfer flavoprotein beta subunit